MKNSKKKDEEIEEESIGSMSDDDLEAEEDFDEDDVDNDEDEEEDDEMAAKLLAGEIDLPGGNETYNDFFDPPAEVPKSKMQTQMIKEIDDIERMMLDKKHWRLRGEIEADERPKNALLDEDLDYDDVGVEKPKTTEDVETLIQNRVIDDVKNQAFDDVKRRKGPSKTREEYRHQLVLDSEKPKPLGELYEEEYRRAQVKENAEDPEWTALRTELLDLFGQLDALANLHFLPKAPMPEVQVARAVPAIHLEEAIPSAVSSQQLLAPQEVARRRLQLKGAEELTATDKRRHLQRKKKRSGIIMRDRRRREGDSETDAMRRVLKMAHRPQSNVVLSGKLATQWGQKVKRAMKSHGGRKGRKRLNRTKVLE